MKLPRELIDAMPGAVRPAETAGDESAWATVRERPHATVVRLPGSSVESEQIVQELMAADPDLPQEGDEGPDEAVAARDRLITIARERYNLGRDTKDEAYAVAKDGPRFARKFRGSAEAFRRELLREYYQRYQKGASHQATAEALATIGALAMDEPQRPLHLRVAQLDDSVLLDLGDEPGRVVQVTTAGWCVLERSPDPVLFYRTNLTGALPEPQHGGSLDQLWEMVNVEEDDRPLMLAWLVQALLPEQSHPILALRGEQGAGKSSAARMLTALLDKSPVQLRKPPRSVNDWVTAATGSWVIALDNLSSISEDMSDSLCRAVTGDGDVRRKLCSLQLGRKRLRRSRTPRRHPTSRRPSARKAEQRDEPPDPHDRGTRCGRHSNHAAAMQLPAAQRRPLRQPPAGGPGAVPHPQPRHG